MNNQERHNLLKKTIRKYISLRMVKYKNRKDPYPNGNCNIERKRITIYYVDSDSLEFIDSLIIHEMGHFIAAKKYGFDHHPISEDNPKKIITEEERAWNEGEKFLRPNCHFLIPKKFNWCKKYCLDTYRFTYYG